MQSDGIWGNIFRYGQRKATLTEILHSVPLFHDLSPKELRILESLVHLRTYQTGETIFLEAEPGAGMYVIRTGRVLITLRQLSGQPVLLAELQKGDFFGEMLLLGDGVRSATRSATATAAERCELVGFFHPDLHEIMNLHPVTGGKIALGLARTLSDRLRYTNSKLRDVWEIRGADEAHSG
jgi:CRP/FNR family cyclic AMP-dependent transcriptional regulator